MDERLRFVARLLEGEKSLGRQDEIRGLAETQFAPSRCSLLRSDASQMPDLSRT